MIKKYIPKSTHNLFLLIAIPILSVFIITNPPTHGIDEGSHTIRAYQLSRGHLYPEPNNKDTLPHEFDEFIKKNFPGPEDRMPFGEAGMTTIPRDSKEVPKTWTDVNTMVYAPVVYLPAAVGFSIANVLNLPIGFSVWVAKIFTAAMYVLLIYCALRFTKDYKFKWIIFVVSLLPVTLYSAATISGDPYTNGVSVLFLSVIFGLLFKAKKPAPSKKTLTLFIGASVLLFFVKTPYLIAFLPLIFLVPNSILLDGKSKAIALKVGLLVAGILVGALVYKIGTTAIYNPFKDMPQFASSPQEQVEYMTTNPQYTARTLLTDSINSFGDRASSMIASFGDTARLRDHSNTNFFVVFFGLLAIIVASTNSEKLRSKGKRIVIVLSLTTLYLLVVLSMWFGNNVGTPVIQGVQGRYFIPLILPLAVLLPRIRYLKGKLEHLIISLTVLTLVFYLVEYLDKIITVYIDVVATIHII